MQRLTTMMVLVFGLFASSVGFAGTLVAEDGSRARVVVSGVALLADGSPAAGATVSVMAHGGRAVAEVDGSFVLEAMVPMTASELSLSLLLDRDETQWVGTATGLGVGAGVAEAGVVMMGSLCEPGWVEGLFCLQGVSGGSVNAAVLWDDGGGEALYVGGSFRSAGCQFEVNRIAKWDGTAWSPLGSGVDGASMPSVSSLAIFDDGSGPALYAGGSFTVAGGSPASRIARWDGASWSALGAGVGGTVITLEVFDDGSGPALYAGGNFSNAGGLNVGSGIARWDGTEWSSVGFGVNGSVFALAVFDDGSGAALYAGGDFSQGFGGPGNNIARWDGSQWSPLGSGVNNSVNALTIFDDGSGPALYAGGAFSQAGGGPASGVARWDGSSWAGLGSGVTVNFQSLVRSLTVFDDGSGPALYAGGGFTIAGGQLVNGIARWDGSDWSALAGPGGTGVITTAGFPSPPTVNVLAEFDDGAGPALFVGGEFTRAGGVTTFNIARWDENGWAGLRGTGTLSAVRAMTVFDDGSGPALYAAGDFTTAGSGLVNRIAKWEGDDWSALVGPEGTGVNGVVNALTVFDDGTGSALYAGGKFTTAGGVLVNRIARWDGSAWSALPGPDGVGVNNTVNAMTVFDDGSGPALYVGGEFITAGGITVIRIARWDGSGWSGLVGPSFTGVNGAVNSFAVSDDESGPGLYVGGSFTSVGGVAANRVARWNGNAWSPLIGPQGNGVNLGVNALAVFDDGSGPALFVGGDFSIAGGVPALRIARWSGTEWSPLVSPQGNGVSDAVNAMSVFDDGSGPALFVGGDFRFAGGQLVERIARWDGNNWSGLTGPVDTGMGSFVIGITVAPFPYVMDLTVFDDGSGPSLYAGGLFLTAGGAVSCGLAKWQGCAVTPVPCVGDLNGDGVVDVDDLGVLLGAFGKSDAGDLNGDGVTDADDLGILLGVFGNACE